MPAIPTVVKAVMLSATALTLLCCSRSPATLSREDLFTYIGNKQNGLLKEQEVNGLTVRISYQPSSLLVLQEMEGYDNKREDSIFVKALEEKYNKSYYFRLKFSKNSREAIRHLGGFDGYSEMLQVLSFRMGSFIYITTPQKDTLLLSDYFFDQSYGKSDGNTLLLTFDRSRLKDSEQFDIHLLECGFGTGALRFRFLKKDLLKTPVAAM